MVLASDTRSSRSASSPLVNRPSSLARFNARDTRSRSLCDARMAPGSDFAASVMR